MPTPKSLGYRWPAEWETHSATWLSWPHGEGISFPGAYERVMPTIVQMIRAIASSEPVNLNVLDVSEENEVRARFRGDMPANVKFFHIPTQEPWCRDHGPTFLTNGERPLAVVNWGYNAWGGKYLPYDVDNVVPTRIAEALNIPIFSPGIVMEGGAIESNGAGTVLTSESCLLNKNRNPHLNREQIEGYLREYLCAEQVLWLGDGIEGDDTDGHIDDLARFVDRATVLTVVEKNTDDPNFEPLRENLDRLKRMKLSDGTPLTVLELPMPARIDREDLRLPASYANYYLTNGAVLLPTYSDPADAVAEAQLKRSFPSRKIIPIDCRELIWGLGAFHCLSQQVPAPQ